MAIASMSISGTEDVKRALQQLPEKFGKQVLQKAMRPALTPIRKLAKKLVPVGAGLNTKGQPRKHLRDTMKTSVRQTKSGGVIGQVGHANKKRDRDASHSHLVAFGTVHRRHKSGKSTGIMPENDYMERARDRALPDFESRFVQKLQEHLERLLMKV